MFAHWSNTETSYRDMEKEEFFCDRCNSDQLHTFRMHEQKTQHYSLFSFGAKRSVSLICHGCLKESQVSEEYEKQKIEKFLKMIIIGEGFELSRNGDKDEAIRKFRNVLEKDPNNIQANFGLAKTLIDQGRVEEAEYYVAKLEMSDPENNQIKELRAKLLK